MTALDAAQVLELRDRLNAWLEGPRAPQDRYDLQATLRGVFAQEGPLPALEHEWMFSPALAARYVQTHEQRLTGERKPRYSPHHVRCQFVKDGIRCRKGEGHENLPHDSAHEEPM